MTKTIIEKVATSYSEVAVFKVEGTLGYHENKTLEKFFAECDKRNIHDIVLDFSSLASLGGGCARIIIEHAEKGGFKLAVAGASKTALKFLRSGAGSGSILFASSAEEAAEMLKSAPSREDSPAEQEPHPASESPKGTGEHSSVDEREEHADSTATGDRADENEAGAQETAEPGKIPDVIILGPAPEDETGGREGAAPEARGDENQTKEPSRARQSGDVLRDLKKKVIQYNSLLTISSDFNKIENRAQLVDAFLLTTIAQIGIEGAAFFEEEDGSFRCSVIKGGESEGDLPSIDAKGIAVDLWEDGRPARDINDLPIDAAAAEALEKRGFKKVSPLVVQEQVRALVFLGKPIRSDLDDEAMEFLKVLLNQAAIAYEKSKRMEEESERTLGLVQTLISLIEENTMGKGNTDLVSNYTYAVATAMNYPEEFLKDLMFGAVLRDIGMIKVSDLIVRSPRELAKEEWEIIKRHPSDGAEMLRRMKFSEHTVHVVLCHHERFNGEGYPNGLEGSNIPLGARIVSVVESYVAMLRDRPNRPALREEEAANTLRENWGMRYDPEVIKSFLEIVEEEMRSGQKIQFSHSELFRLERTGK